MEKQNKKEDIEVTALSNVFEKFGRYQIVQFMFLCLPAFFVSIININYVFTVGELDYRCRIPECEDANSTFAVSWWPNATIDRCSKPLLEGLSGGCFNSSFSGELAPCKEWVYETQDTVVAALNLACKPWLSKLIGTIHSGGSLVSMLVGGWMLDRFGRKPTLIICMVGSCVGMLKTLATSYPVYVAVEFMEGTVSSGTYAASMVTMLEISGTRHRVLAGVIFSYAIYVAECMFACVAMFVPYWKTLVFIINGPTIIFISYIFLIRESPRWQILNGKTKQAKETLMLVADSNNINLDRQELIDADETVLKEKFNIGTYEEGEGILDAMKSRPILVRILVASVTRFTASFVYYGLMINSVYLPGNKYTNFLLSTVMSFPGDLLAMVLMNRIGRKIPLIAGYSICGVLCVLSGFVPDNYTWLKIALCLIGKMLIAGCYTSIMTYTVELFPTSARGSLLGIGAFMATLGTMVAPLTPLLNSVSEALPTILFGCSAAISGLLLTLTPETKDQPLMDTIQQVEDSVRKEGQNKNHTQTNCHI